MMRTQSLIRRVLASRSPRERQFLWAALATLMIGGLIMITEWAVNAQSQLDQRIPAARTMLTRMLEDAGELNRLKQLPGPAPATLDTQAQVVLAAAISRGLSITVEFAGNEITATGSGSLGGIFDWLGSVQADHRLRPNRVQLESTGGVVHFEATLAPAPNH